MEGRALIIPEFTAIKNNLQVAGNEMCFFLPIHTDGVILWTFLPGVIKPLNVTIVWSLSRLSPPPLF